MNKQGFTLQEALITVGIIGIIAAITVPAIVKLAPDQNSAKYLKAYATLTSLTKEMLANPSLYWVNSNKQGCDGLECADRPTATSVPPALLSNIPDNATFVEKYAGILAYYMHSSNISTINNGQQVSFDSNNGVRWLFIEAADNAGIIAVVDLNTNNGMPFIFGENVDSINDADSFMFNITNDGAVEPVDGYGLAILNTPTTAINSKKNIQKSLEIGANQPVDMMHPEGFETSDGNWFSGLCSTVPIACSDGAGLNINPNDFNSHGGHILLAPRSRNHTDSN